MKLKSIAMAAVLAAATGGVAAARPDTRAMSCAQAQDLVARSGAVVMSTGRHTYRRFVSQRRYCDRGETLFPEYAPTRDHPRCFVGYRCDQPLFLPFED